MKSTIALLLLFGAFQGFGQSLILPKPSIDLRNESSKTGGFQECNIYKYFLEYIEPWSEKLEIKRYDWGEDTSICSFNQVFKGGIHYGVETCEEARGVGTTIMFPSSNLDQIRQWVEWVFEASREDEEINVWDEERLKFQPEEPVPGCYYELQPDTDEVVVRVYCGC